MFDQIVRGIHVKESEITPDLVDLAADYGFFINRKFSQDFRLRRKVAEKLATAEKNLPDNMRFMIYEAFRPRSRQFELWSGIITKLKLEHPEWNDEQLTEQGSVFVANPYGFGSGHQAGAAVDITLCNANGEPFFMGNEIDDFDEKTLSASTHISDDARKLRNILKTTLETEGIINYPDEWWHFSYGDRLWAEVTNRTEAFFAPID